MTDRYKIIDTSWSNHCYTVVDTSKPEIIGGKHYIDIEGIAHYESISECFDIDHARMIVYALNRGETNV